MKHISCFLALLCLAFSSCGQQSTTTKPLTVGDTLPAIILTDVVNFPVSEIQLSQHNNKLLIIDFWGRYCIPCLKALPKYDSLQQQFKDSILILTASDFSTKKEFLAAKQKFGFLQQLRLPVLLHNNPFVPLFPYKLLPHIIWVGPDQVVKAITGAEQLTAYNIRKALGSAPLHWPVKKDAVEFDYTKPLLTLAQPVTAPMQLYYASFSSFIDGIAPPSGTHTDTAAAVSVTAFYNYGLLALCQLALDYRTDAAREQFVLQVKDSGRFVRTSQLGQTQWQQQNSYCYYLRLPMTVPEQHIRQLVQTDLVRWFSILGYSIRKEAGTARPRYIITDLTY